MKRIVISILLATLFASIPVFAESRGAHPKSLLGAGVISANPAGAPSPQNRRRYRRRRLVTIRIGRRRRRRRDRDDRRIYVLRRGRRERRERRERRRY
jgi:hypothetical protein